MILIPKLLFTHLKVSVHTYVKDGYNKDTTNHPLKYEASSIMIHKILGIDKV